MNVEKELKEIVSHVLEKHQGVFLVDFKHKANLFEITIDGDKSLGIYDISDISREINHLADEKMPEEEYSLDISSPGADSDLVFLRQYPKHIGREFMVLLNNEEQFNGKLNAVSGEELEFQIQSKTKGAKKQSLEQKTIAFKDIKKANIILSFK